MDFDMTAVERELCRIPEVRAARIVADERGRPIEVHVLASPGKHAKQVVRDIQSVAMASVGLEIDHRVISVVQLDDGTATMAAPPATAEPAPGGDNGNATNDPAPPAPGSAAHDGAVETGAETEERIVVDTVVALRRGVGATVEVVLRRGNETASADAEGTAATSAIHRMVADATLEALRQLVPAATRVHVETATVAQLGGRAVAVTTLVLLVPPNEEIVSGSAPVRSGGEHEALARAVLDATNRRLRSLE